MKALLIFLIIILPLQLLGQTLFGTTGGTSVDSQHQFDFSIGEPIVTEISVSDFTYNIGFQQPYYDIFTSVLELKTEGYQISPNPFLNAFRFEASSEIERYFLLDASGREVYQSQTTGTGFEYKVSDLPKGFYQLRVLMKSGKMIGSKLVHD